MTRKMDDLDLRSAFRPIPDSCRDALLHAARSVKEEKEVKRASFRAVIIAAIVIVAMTAVAFAAGSLMGWTDFFGYYDDIGVPQAAVDQMQVENTSAWQVGPLSFTVRELICDGHIALGSAVVTVTDGSEALLCTEPWDAIGANGDNGEAVAKRLGVSPDTSWVEAAKQTGLPLYRVSFMLEVDPAYSGGETMSDPMWNEDGSLTCFCMPALNPDAVRDKLTAAVWMRVAPIDVDADEEGEAWINREQTVTIPVAPVLETRTYIPEKETVIAGQTLRSVKAMRYVTGAYLTLEFDASQDLYADSIFGLYDVTLHDAQGTELPGGMNLSASLDMVIRLRLMAGVETLPETLTLADGTVLKAQ